MLRHGSFCQPASPVIAGRWLHPGRHVLELRATLTDALALSEQQRWEEAAVAWQQLISEELPADLLPQAHCALGDALQKLGQDELALQSFQRGARDWAPALLRVAQTWRRLGCFGRAEGAYRRVWRRRRGGAMSEREVSEAVSGAAVMMLRQGKLRKMRRLLETWTSMRPEDPRAARNLLLLLGFLDQGFSSCG